jgi:tRNA A37 threonylcarbamoyladenosine modification protein TsaB
MYELFIISISNPIQIGIYKDEKLLQTISKEGKTSDILPNIINDILKEKSISNIYFVNGPGSYMAIKVAYIFLKTISQIKKIPFMACSGFELNKNSPIKALGKKYFFLKDNGEIFIEFLKDNDKINNFILPSTLNKSIFFKDTLPNYQLPVVS